MLFLQMSLKTYDSCICLASLFSFFPFFFPSVLGMSVLNSHCFSD